MHLILSVTQNPLKVDQISEHRSILKNIPKRKKSLKTYQKTEEYNLKSLQEKPQNNTNIQRLKFEFH